MKGRRVSGNLLFVLLVRLRIDREVDRATITPVHHRISQMLLQETLKPRSSREAFPGPRTVTAARD
jgi:hypothetical protein